MQVDLAFLAVYFDVCLLTYVNYNMQPRQPKGDDFRPTVSVRNKRNSHWLTVFDEENRDDAIYLQMLRGKLNDKVISLLSKKDNASQALEKAIKGLEEDKIRFDQAWLLDEPDESGISLTRCHAVYHLYRLYLLTQDNFNLLDEKPELTKEIAKLANLDDESFDDLYEILEEARKRGVIFDNELQLLFEDSDRVKQYIQIKCLAQDIAKRQMAPESHNPFAMFGSSKKEKIDAIQKLITYLDGKKKVEVTEQDVSAFRNGDLARLIKGLKINLRLGPALTPDQLAAPQPPEALPRKLTH